MALMGSGDLASSALRFSRTRGRIGGTGDQGLQYPSPFFDIGQTYLPATVKQMFRWCRYYYLVNPLINTVASKMAEYPVTDIILDTDRLEHKERWSAFLGNQLRYRAFQIEVGLDYYVYGNALVSIFYPFVKILICKNCNYEKEAAQADYRFMNFEFHWNCPKCGEMGPCKVRDHYVKAPKGVRLIRWNPEDVDIRYNEINGEYEYYYTIPVQLKNDVIIGKKSAVETVPQLFIEALRLKKAVVFSRDNIFHFKRPTLAGKDRGWGTPMILPVLKDTFYLQILRKAQESIAMEHIVPLRVLFPQAGSASSDPYCVSLSTLIETKEGIRPASEVQQGDWVKTHMGLWKRVEGVKDREIKSGEKAYKFTVASLPAFPFELSEGHPIFGVKKPKRFRGYESVLDEPEFIEAKELGVGDFVCYPTRRQTWKGMSLDLGKYCPERACTDRFLYRRLNQEAAVIYEYFEHNGAPSFGHEERAAFLQSKGWLAQDYVNAYTAFTQQENIDRIPRFLSVTEDLAYLIGIYAAEGSPKDTAVSLGLHSKETGIMDRLDTALQNLGFAVGHRYIHGNAATYDIGDVFLGSLLPQLCGKGAQNKRLPRLILEAPDTVALAAVEAVFQGDGCSFDTTTRREGLKTVSPQLAMDVRTLLLSMGLISTLQKAVPGENEIAKLPYYQVNLNGAQGDALQDLFAGKAIKGSGRCGFIRDGYIYLRIKGKEEAPHVKVVRGFQVNGDKSFCVAGVATHNSSVNLADWRDQVAQEIRQWRADNNYIPIMSLPIGQQTIGGDGRALLLSQEIRVWSEHIIAGMGVPVELIFGGLSYSGSNVSMRMLENMHLGYLTDHKALLHWVIERVSSYLGWAPVKARFKPFKMADDLQRKAYLFQLSQAGKISDETLLADADLDSQKEDKILEIETARRANVTKKQRLLQADIEGEAAMVTAKWQLKAQNKQMAEQLAMQNEMNKDQGAFQAEVQKDLMDHQMSAQTGQPQAPNPDLQPAPRDSTVLDMPKAVKSPLVLQSSDGSGSEDVQTMLLARKLADRVAQVPIADRQGVLTRLQSTSPDLYNSVLGLMASGPNGPSAASSASARPLPQQRAPRRGVEAALV